MDSKLYQLIWSPLLTNYTHELMTAKQNTDNRHLKFWHWKKVRSTSEKVKKWKCIVCFVHLNNVLFRTLVSLKNIKATSWCLIYVIYVCLRIVVSNTYCIVFLFSLSSSCVLHVYVVSFSGLSILIASSEFSNVYFYIEWSWSAPFKFSVFYFCHVHYNRAKVFPH